jgi:hypothetical protein
MAGIIAMSQRPRNTGDARGERTAFLATLGVASATIFTVLILVGALLPRLFLDTCGG